MSTCSDACFVYNVEAFYNKHIAERLQFESYGIESGDNRHFLGKSAEHSFSMLTRHEKSEVRRFYLDKIPTMLNTILGW